MRHAESPTDIQLETLFTQALLPITMSILASNRTSRDAVSGSIPHMIREACADFGSGAESVDAFYGADGVADEVVVDVADVSVAAGADAAQF